MKYAKHNPGDTSPKSKKKEPEVISAGIPEWLTTAISGPTAKIGKAGLSLLKKIAKRKAKNFRSATGKTTPKEGKHIADQIKKYEQNKIKELEMPYTDPKTGIRYKRKSLAPGHHRTTGTTGHKGDFGIIRPSSKYKK